MQCAPSAVSATATCASEAPASRKIWTAWPIAARIGEAVPPCGETRIPSTSEEAASVEVTGSSDSSHTGHGELNRCSAPNGERSHDNERRGETSPPTGEPATSGDPSKAGREADLGEQEQQGDAHQSIGADEFCLASGDSGVSIGTPTLAFWAFIVLESAAHTGELQHNRMVPSSHPLCMPCKKLFAPTKKGVPKALHLLISRCRSRPRFGHGEAAYLFWRCIWRCRPRTLAR